MAEGEKRKQGRPTKCTPVVVDEICRRIADGETLKSICEDEHMPHARKVLEWAQNDSHGFTAPYRRAQEQQAHRFVDELVEIADDGRNDWMVRKGRDGQDYYSVNNEAVQRSRMRMEVRKWLASKRLPDLYGDNQTVDVRHTIDVARIVRPQVVAEALPALPPSDAALPGAGPQRGDTAASTT